MAGGPILTINTGSSSLKAALYGSADGNAPELVARAERIGLRGNRLRIGDPRGEILVERDGDLSDHAAAVGALLAWLRDAGADAGLEAVGHRVVHGGSRYAEPEVVTSGMIAALREIVPLAPDHMPQALAAIEAAKRAYPDLPQVACFDTAFHRRMPPVARLYPLPRRLTDAGIRRYGFHGLSYESVMDELHRIDPDAAGGRMLIAHLGNGASMAAVRAGVGIDTTMGFTPTGGLMMGTRTGDLDPGVLLHLLRTEGLSPAELGALVTEQSGLLGVSGTSADMRDLLEREAADEHAAEAVELFCYRTRTFAGAMAAALGGVETLVFTGGIGERSAAVRQRICAGLGFLGVRLDPARNAEHAPVISPDSAPATVRVVETNEDLMIARHTARLMAQEGA